MVHNPKNSQKVMSWCLETAIVLIFNTVESIGSRIKHSELGRYLSQSTSDLNISGRQISSMVYDLKRRNYIEIEDGDSVKLTNKAKIKIIDQIASTNNVDGKCRLISFDIPETKRTNRNNFRRAIKRIGFRQVQKSLWVSNRNVSDLVELAIKEYKVSEYVAYFVADRSNIDSHIANILNPKKDIKRDSECVSHGKEE